MKENEIRRKVRVNVFDAERHDAEWPPTNAIKFLEWFAGKLELIPDEYRKNATFEIESVSSYEDSHYSYIQISYERQETDIEMASREAKELRNQEICRENELLLLASLKAKYGL